MSQEIDELAEIREALASWKAHETELQAQATQFLASLGQKLKGKSYWFSEMQERLIAEGSRARLNGLPIKRVVHQPDFSYDQDYGAPVTVLHLNGHDKFRIGIVRVPQNPNELLLVFAVESITAET